MERAFTGVNQRHGEVIVQVAESTFILRSGSRNDQMNLGHRQLYAYAMRSFLSMPEDPVMEDLLAKSTVKADDTALCRFANLADRLGFESPEIAALKNRSIAKTRERSEQLKPRLVTASLGEGRKQRCGLPRKQAY
jgi:Protein of unknown function (DUF3723)